ncbi:hypothetical protein [Flavobacterium sp. C3NV]|uniref:hypothetical protein n=2 Tax=unclassified Flavobacterium TaxID=196869 RepID=UPI00398FEAE7
MKKMIKKGLVYDSQKGFSRFLKYEFKEDYTFDVYKNFKKFDDVIKDYYVIIFVVYSDNELLDLMRIYKKGVPLIVSTVNKEIKSKLEKIEDLLIFDPTKVKSEMRLQLKFYFNMI